MFGERAQDRDEQRWTENILSRNEKKINFICVLRYNHPGYISSIVYMFS